jgi:hypothetical protein
MTNEAEDKYAPGTTLKSCDIRGVVQEEDCPREDGKVRVLWDGGQCYLYEREWLNCNAQLTDPKTGMVRDD